MFSLQTAKDTISRLVIKKRIVFGKTKKIQYIEYFMESARVRCLHMSCGVSESERRERRAKRTSEISDTKQRVCKHRTKHFPCGIMFVI